MAVRAPKSLMAKGKDPLAAAFDYEAAQEMAYALGQAGKRAEAAVGAFNAADKTDPRRELLLSEASKAVHAWFIQRELCGMRRHEAVIKELKIPGAVLARLGVS